ncbi:MAG: serine/threonine-protein kinase, partial [Thermoleophilia bacterium]
ARLRHERCLRAYAFERDDSHVYIAYEYVPGKTVREAMRAGELDDRSAVEAAAQILDGLAHAHARGIVHRDVKPSNVLLKEGPEVSVRLLDFGLAQMKEEETLTAAGDVPGTLAYIAPERLAGKEATPAADVWGVGVMLWEALAGPHPFWSGSLLDTARAIGAGAPPLTRERPDLPKALLVAVDRALSLDPARRPSAERLARVLRGAFRERERKPRAELRPLVIPGGVDRLAAPILAAVGAGWSATALPFYPAHWALLVAAVAAGATAWRPRVGLALTLAVPLFPLGNFSLGLALLYGVVALAWLALSWGEPRSGLLFALGPLAAPLGALGLVPLTALGVRSPVRRAAQAGTAVLVAALAAGIRGTPLPFTHARPPLGLGIAGSDSPVAVAGALWQALLAHPALGLEAATLAAAAAVLPLARTRDLWGVAGAGAAMLAATVLVPGVAVWPLVLTAWVTCAALAVAPQLSLNRGS